MRSWLPIIAVSVIIVSGFLAVRQGVFFRSFTADESADRATPGETAYGPRDSIVAERDGWASYEPYAWLTYRRLEETSGLVKLDGAYFVHNDSGDDSVLYRSGDLSFTGAQVLLLDGGEASDWEELTVLEGDLLICDFGDNGFKRADATLYRARYRPTTPERRAGLDLVATYPIRYPNGPQNAEAAFVYDGKVYVISKAAADSRTYVYRFDTLTDGKRDAPPSERNVATLLGELELGEGELCTGADYDAQTDTVVVLTYNQIAYYPRAELEGPPPRRTLFYARQCEAVFVDGSRLIIMNEQRDVITVEGFRERQLKGLTPRLQQALLRSVDRLPVGTDDGLPVEWRDVSSALPFTHARTGEALRWLILDDELRLWMRVEVDDPRPARIDKSRVGSGVALMFGQEARLRSGPEETRLFVGLDESGEQLAIYRLDEAGRPRVSLREQVELAHSRVTATGFDVELRIPREVLFGADQQAWPEDFRFALFGLRVHATGAELRFGGGSMYSAPHPFTWGEVGVFE